jgi:integrase/recombinase XerC
MENTFLEVTTLEPFKDNSVIRRAFEGIGVSETTRVQYERSVIPFIKWVGKRPLHQNILLDWKRHLQSKTDIGTGTKNKYLTVSRVFLRELNRTGILPHLNQEIKTFRVTKVHKRLPLTDDDVRNVLSYLDGDSVDSRTRVIVGLMYYQGLRRIEVSRLSVDDFNRGDQTLLVWGKGRDDKELVDLHPRMVTILVNYLKEQNLKSGSPLFPSVRRRQVGSLSSNMIWRLVTAVHKELGIHKNLHSYRKVFTSKLIDSGLNLLEVRQYTRHRDVTQLQVYYDRIDKNRTLTTYYKMFSGIGSPK